MNQNLIIFLLICLSGQLSGQALSLADSTQLPNTALSVTQTDSVEPVRVAEVSKQTDSTYSARTTEIPKQADSTQLVQNTHIIPVLDSIKLSQSVLRFKLDSIDYKTQTATRLEWQAGYMSNIRYSGRDYGVKGYGLSTQLSLKHKSGFWLSAIAYNWQTFDIKIPKSDFVVGYARQLGSRIGGSVSYSRWLYYGRSQSELRWAFNHFMSVYMGINATYFTIAPQIYYMTSPGENVAQFAISISKNKEWRPFWGGKLILEPSLTWMTSTKDRYDSTDPTVKAGKILRVIDYELTLPLIYRRVGRYEISPRYVLSLPVNVTPYDGVEEGKLTSVFSLDFKYILWHKK